MLHLGEEISNNATIDKSKIHIMRIETTKIKQTKNIFKNKGKLLKITGNKVRILLQAFEGIQKIIAI